MNNHILDYNYQSYRILHTFYPNVDTRDLIHHSKYDVIICNRDNIQNETEFNQIMSFTDISTKILVDITTESGGLDNFITFFDQLTKKYPHINFYLLVDSEFDFMFNSNVITLRSYKLSLLAFFENFGIKNHDSQLILNDLKIYEKQNGILSLNGSIRTHRILLLNELLKRKTIFNNSNNTISFLLYSDTSYDKLFFENHIKNMMNQNFIEESDYLRLLSIKDKLPITIYAETNDRPNTEINFYYNKIINLVTENTAGYDGTNNDKYKTITFTEKAWKPFKTHHIPLYISLPGYVNTLRKLGFDVFDDFINHEYDNESDHKKRLIMVVNELERISKLDCLSFYKNNYKRFVKNYIHIYTLKAEAYLELQSFMYSNNLI
jgi:hypothetical protein